MSGPLQGIRRVVATKASGQGLFWRPAKEGGAHEFTITQRLGKRDEKKLPMHKAHTDTAAI